MLTFSELQSKSREQLINRVYNIQIHGIALSDDREKLIPFMGSFWREMDFVNRRIHIARDEGVVAVMQPSKWDYPSRDMTPEECDKFIEYIDRALEAERQGGLLIEAERQMKAILAELFAWMQTLEIKEAK